MKIKFAIEEDNIVKEVCLTTTPIEYLVISSALKQFEENPENVGIDIMTAKQMRIDICNNRAESEK